METRICKCCQVEKPITAFQKRGRKRPGQRRYTCRYCWDYKDKRRMLIPRKEKLDQETLLKNKQERHRRRIADNQQKAFEYKGGRCTNKDCPLGDTAYHTIVYDYHHIDPETKETEVSALWHRSWERLKIELDKCVLLCCVCHRLLHAGLIAQPIPNTMPFRYSGDHAAYSIIHGNIHNNTHSC